MFLKHWNFLPRVKRGKEMCFRNKGVLYSSCLSCSILHTLLSAESEVGTWEHLPHFIALTSHTLNLTWLHHPYSKPVTHPLRLRMKPLNPPCRCLPLSCPSDGQDYWVVLLCSRAVTEGCGELFHVSFCEVLSKQRSRASHAKGLEQRCLKSSARSSQPPCLGLFSQLGSLLVPEFHTLGLFILSLSHPACLSCASLQLSSCSHSCWKIPKAGKTGGCMVAQPRFLDGKKL